MGRSLLNGFIIFGLCTVTPVASAKLSAKTTVQNNMQSFHLSQARTKLDNNKPEHAWGDLAYIVCQVPNHIEALTIMLEIAPELNKQEELGLYLAKAQKLFPKDQAIQLLNSKFVSLGEG